MNSDKDRPGARHGGRFVAAFALSLLACAGASATPGPVRSAIADPSVDAKVAAAGLTEVPVLITLKARTAPDSHRGRPDEMIRALRQTAAASQRTVRAKLDGPSRSYWLVNAISTTVDAGELEALRNDPAVASIDLDPRVTITGDAVANGASSWGVGAVNAPKAWSSFGVTGAGIRIGSIDTGVNAANPELAGAIAGWKDFVGGQPTPYDDNGHGTHTIGTMVARNITGAQIGIAPGASVIVAKAIGADGSASGSNLLAAAQWMTDPDGDPATADFPTVINNSWTSAGANNEWFRPMVQTWVAMGIAPVFGAGNTPGPIGNPASYPESIAVGQLEQSGTIAINSSRGVVNWVDGSGAATAVTKPDLTAPGGLISSTVGTGYGLYSGTSMAAPHVAAGIALLQQARPGLSVAEIRDLLRATAIDKGIPGHDADYGAGALDVAAAIAATGVPAVPGSAPATREEPTPSSASAGRPTTIRVLRVTRRGSQLVVQGRTSAPARMRLALRPRTGARLNAVNRVIATAQSRTGAFTVKLPVGKLPRRSYVLVVTATNAAGETIATTTKTVRLR